MVKKTLLLISGLLFVLTLGVFATGQAEGAKSASQLPAALQKIKSSGGQYAVFDALRKAADAGQPYPGSPGAGKTLGFANIYGTQPYCVAVQKGLVAQAELAGFTKKNLYLMDNQYNSNLGLKNADIMLAKHPNVFVEYQADAKVNVVVSKKFGAAGIPLVAVDVPVPNAPFVGIDNTNAAVQVGMEMAKLIRQKWGGWDKVDLVVLLQNPIGGKVLMQRSEPVIPTLEKEFGASAKNKIVTVDGGTGQSAQAKQAMENVLAAHPNAKRIVFTSLNDEMSAGAVAALQDLGRWNQNDIINVAIGCDALGVSMLRAHTTTADLAFLPEDYGRYIVPAAVARMYGQPVPANIFVTNKMLTLANLDQYYPPKK